MFIPRTKYIKEVKIKKKYRNSVIYYLVWLKNESDMVLSDLSEGMLSNGLQYLQWDNTMFPKWRK